MRKKFEVIGKLKENGEKYFFSSPSKGTEQLFSGDKIFILQINENSGFDWFSSSGIIFFGYWKEEDWMKINNEIVYTFQID